MCTPPPPACRAVPATRRRCGRPVWWRSRALLSDLNGDNRDDLVVGSAKADRINVVGTKTTVVKDTGRVSCYSGQSQAELFSVPGKLASDYFGAAINVMGDVNGDGCQRCDCGRLG
jgi:hypothetical protein